MKIYVVSHYYDNGESYEDYREYKDSYMFSTEGKAYAFYCDKILSDYEGKYLMYEWELDTQNVTLIEKSPWVDCTSPYQYFHNEYPEDYEPVYECDSQEQYDSKDYIDDNIAESVSLLEELEAEEEWLTTKREQGEILDEIETDRLNDALKESDEVWASLGMLD